jgi:hypothetical protein
MPLKLPSTIRKRVKDYRRYKRKNKRSVTLKNNANFRKGKPNLLVKEKHWKRRRKKKPKLMKLREMPY